MPADTPEPQPAGQPEPPVDDMSYESALGELETIIDNIESGEIGLAESLRAYQRGQALLKRCRALLADAEQRIEELTIDDLDGAAESQANARTDDQA